VCIICLHVVHGPCCCCCAAATAGSDEEDEDNGEAAGGLQALRLWGLWF
jgi:hypothetical protein